MKLLIEASPLEQDSPSGVNYFTEWLAKSLETKTDETFRIGYFYLNFLRRKPIKNPLCVAARKEGRLQQITTIPQRVYAKLIYANIAPPLLVQKSDWVLFPNFYLWPTIRKAKKAVIIHDIGYLVHPEYVDNKNRVFLERVVGRSIKHADLIVSNSQFTTDELISKAHVPAEKIVTISIPVSPEQFDSSLDRGRERLDDRYGIKKKYILSLGTLEPRKNLETIINAYCLLSISIRNEYSLVLAGKWGWKTESLRSLLTEKQEMGYDIIVTGYIDNDDRATLYRNASFYAISSYYEGFGMPLLEALYCGIPTVSVDIPVLREVGADACIWTDRNPKLMAQAFTDIIDDPSKATALGRAGKERAAQFSWDSVAEIIKERLKEDVG